MNSVNYELAYTEVLEILKHVTKDEYNKIPKEKIDYMEKNARKDIEYIFDKTNPNISPEAYSILIYLYKTYVATDKEKENINNQLRKNEQKKELEKKEKYDSNKIFDNTINKENIEIKSYNENKDIIIKENWFKKIIKKIKSFFKK